MSSGTALFYGSLFLAAIVVVAILFRLGFFLRYELFPPGV